MRANAFVNGGLLPAHMRGMKLERACDIEEAEQKEKAALAVIICSKKDGQGEDIAFLSRAVAKAGVACTDDELEVALWKVKEQERERDEDTALTLNFKEFRELMSVLVLCSSETASWPETAYAREFCHDDAGVPIADAGRTGSCTGINLRSALERLMIPGAGGFDESFDDLETLLVARARETQAFHQLSRRPANSSENVIHYKKKTEASSGDNNGKRALKHRTSSIVVSADEVTMLERAVSQAGYTLKADHWTAWCLKRNAKKAGENSRMMRRISTGRSSVAFSCAAIETKPKSRIART